MRGKLQHFQKKVNSFQHKLEGGLYLGVFSFAYTKWANTVGRG